MDLAELLGNAKELLDHLKGKMVGWKVLRGVWNNHPYPIIWITDSGKDGQNVLEDWNREYFRSEETKRTLLSQGGNQKTEVSWR